MKNLLFFLWMMFFPLVEDIANWVVFKTKQKPLPDGYFGGIEAAMQLILYFTVGYLLYEG